MKLMYKIMIFFVIFYMMILVVNSLSIFPHDAIFYSDLTEDELKDIKNLEYEAVVTTLFVPQEAYGLSDAAVTSLVIFIVGLGALTAILTHNPIMPAVVIVGYCFFVMLTNSYDFLQKIFYNPSWSSTSLQYLAVCIGAGLVVIAMITVVEMTAHGRSG